MIDLVGHTARAPVLGRDDLASRGDHGLDLVDHGGLAVLRDVRVDEQHQVVQVRHGRES
jgi:hypothetical protein